MITYKAFDKDFSCRGFKYEVGQTYKHDGDVEICSSGFHSCESPFDCWLYYDMTEARFAEAEIGGKTATHKEDSKIASAEITIKAELTLPEFIKRGVEWLIEHTKSGKDENDKGKDYARIGSSGYSAQIGSSGDSARIGSSGDSAQIGSSGDSARIGSSGDSARIGSSGDYAQIGSSGYSARIGSSGDYARIGSSGYSARIDAAGKDSVVASAGYNARVKGAGGTWISVAEYNDEGKCVGFATGCIGRVGLKPDTWYQAKGGKLVEVK